MSRVSQFSGDILAVEAIETQGGIANGTNKLLVTDDYYVAFVQGGVMQDVSESYFENTRGTLTRYATNLTAGTYKIVVEVLNKKTGTPETFRNNGQRVQNIT